MQVEAKARIALDLLVAEIELERPIAVYEAALVLEHDLDAVIADDRVDVAVGDEQHATLGYAILQRRLELVLLEDEQRPVLAVVAYPVDGATRRIAYERPVLVALVLDEEAAVLQYAVGGRKTEQLQLLQLNRRIQELSERKVLNKDAKRNYSLE